MTKYKAQIEFISREDDYQEGELLETSSSWNETLIADTKEKLRERISEITYSKWENISDEQINEYDWCTEYHADYLANEDNNGEASEREIEQWKLGKIKLYGVSCHILVTQITEKKTTL